MNKIAYLLLSALIAFQIPSVHRRLLRSYTAGKVVKITEVSGRAGGTGFYVKASSGTTYILTNSHVCHLAVDGVVYVSNDQDGSRIPHAIVEDADFTDLCLIDAGLTHPRGISLGVETMDELVYLIGHPKLQPITMGSGELVGEGVVEVLDHINPTDADCNKPKQKRITVTMLFFPMDVCMMSISSYISNIVALPGSSGSPLVNWRGQLVGVLYAGDSEGGNWGVFITLKDITQFLEKR